MRSTKLACLNGLMALLTFTCTQASAKGGFNGGGGNLHLDRPANSRDVYYAIRDLPARMIELTNRLTETASRSASAMSWESGIPASRMTSLLEKLEKPDLLERFYKSKFKLSLKNDCLDPLSRVARAGSYNTKTNTYCFSLPEILAPQGFKKRTITVTELPKMLLILGMHEFAHSAEALEWEAEVMEKITKFLIEDSHNSEIATGALANSIRDFSKQVALLQDAINVRGAQFGKVCTEIGSLGESYSDLRTQIERAGSYVSSENQGWYYVLTYRYLILPGFCWENQHDLVQFEDQEFMQFDLDVPIDAMRARYFRRPRVNDLTFLRAELADLREELSQLGEIVKSQNEAIESILEDVENDKLKRKLLGKEYQ